MNYEVSDDGAADLWDVTPNIAIRLVARELRRERTGTHGRVGIALGGNILRYDVFNIGRAEDRTKLANGAHKALPADIANVLSAANLAHRLDLFCLYLGNSWESDRVTVVEVDPVEEPPRKTLLLPPLIQRGAGTILFGPPSSGKSWTMALIAVSLASGETTLWPGTRQSPVLYVDMERAQESFQRRLHAIARVMGKPLPKVPFIAARGGGLLGVRRKIMTYAQEHPGLVVLYDSISRAGLGSLVEDSTANQMIDTANACSGQWLGIAHTPRADRSHSYGSVHFEAGADLMVRMASEQRGDALACSLTITKNNDGRNGRQMAFVLEFDEHETLRGFHTVDRADGPSTSEQATGLSVERLIAEYLGLYGASTAEEIAAGTGRSVQGVRDAAANEHAFQKSGSGHRGDPVRYANQP